MRHSAFTSGNLCVRERKRLCTNWYKAFWVIGPRRLGDTYSCQLCRRGERIHPRLRGAHALSRGDRRRLSSRRPWRPAATANPRGNSALPGQRALRLSACRASMRSDHRTWPSRTEFYRLFWVDLFVKPSHIASISVLYIMTLCAFVICWAFKILQHDKMSKQNSGCHWPTQFRMFIRCLITVNWTDWLYYSIENLSTHMQRNICMARELILRSDK